MAVGDFEKIRIRGILGAHQVNLAAEQQLERFHEPKEAVGIIMGLCRIKFVEEVNIAGAGVKIVACGRAEKFQAAHTVLAAQRVKSGHDILRSARSYFCGTNFTTRA